MSRVALPAFPDLWTTASIGKIARVLYGKALGANKREEQGNVTVFGSSGIIGRHSMAMHPGPSMVIGRKGTVGNVYYAPGPFWCIDTTFYLDEISPVIDVEFLTYMLQVVDLSRLSIVVGVPGISREDIEAQWVPLPPLAEQQRIVSIMRQAGQLTRLRKQADHRARRLPYALFQEMFERSQPTWRKHKLGEIIRLEAGKSFAAKGHPACEGKWGILKVSCVSSGRFQPEENKELLDDTHPLSDLEVKDGDLLVSRANTKELVGASAIARNPPPRLMIPDKLWRIVFQDDSATNLYFLHTLLNTPRIRQEISRRATGTSASMKNISQDKFLDIDIELPPLDEQRSFEDKLHILWDEVFDNQIETTKGLNRLLQSLLSQAFTGKLTATWRERHAEELHDAAIQRDIALGLRRERPRVIDFKSGRVTQAEQEEFQRQVADQMASAANSLLDAFKTQLLPFADLSKQVAFTNLAEAIQPALPDYSELVNQTLSQSLSALSRSALDGLAQQSQALAKLAQASLVDAVQESAQAYHLALARQLTEIAAQMRRQILLAELPQPHRTVHKSLDEVSLTLLREANARPAYFRPEDLVDDQISVLEAGEKLHMLEALGLVRRVQVRDQSRYRLVDDETERASKEEWMV